MADTTPEIDRIRARLLELGTEQAILERRLAELSSPLTSAGLDINATGDSHGRILPPADKVALLQRLFAGRTNVFPLCWENSRDGRSGYATACANEWERGICGKPQVKCGECPNQAFTESQDHDERAAGGIAELSKQHGWPCVQST